MASANNTFKSSEEYRRQKELEEARKAGIAPAEVDEDGREINPHIPQYMSHAPWYLNNNQPSLKHQKNWKERQQDNGEWYDRGALVFQAKKWRKGACENCGAMSHTTKNCMERPRQRGARWTNLHIAPDEKVQELEGRSWDAKRDRWNGYEPSIYAKVVEKHERLENLRKEKKNKEEVERRYRQADTEERSDDEDKIDDAQDAGFGEVKKRVRTTAGGASGSVRNLRIREDTAKYLLNLDPNSAHYDPKSRSMREDPNPHKPMSDKTFAGDNFVRQSGEYQGWQALNLHSIQAQQRGLDVNMQAVPSQVELLYRQYKAKKERAEAKTQKSVVERYGQLAEMCPDDLKSLKESDQYVEFDKLGRVISGAVVKPRSRYDEDVMINNHTSVWGSWWSKGQWGYACCHQFVRNSYCTGEKGREIEAEPICAETRTDDVGADLSPSDEKRKNEAGLDLWGTEVTEADLDPELLKAARERLQHKRKLDEIDEKDRAYNSITGAAEEVTQEDIEAYRMEKLHTSDPLRAMEKAKQSQDSKDYGFV